ncbi:MAG: hypothetical protein WC455_15095 [Dehalococcoidia bacterium]
MTTKIEWTSCARCNRGGNGNDKDKCACGWSITDLNSPLGCYLGTQIVGEVRREPENKLTRSQRNYQRYLEIDPGFSFAEWMGFVKYRRVRNAH